MKQADECMRRNITFNNMMSHMIDTVITEYI